MSTLHFQTHISLFHISTLVYPIQNLGYVVSPKRAPFPVHPMFVSVTLPNLPAKGSHTFLAFFPLLSQSLVWILFCYSLPERECFRVPPRSCHPTWPCMVSSLKSVPPAQISSSMCPKLYSLFLPNETLPSLTTCSFVFGECKHIHLAIHYRDLGIIRDSFFYITVHIQSMCWFNHLNASGAHTIMSIPMTIAFSQALIIFHLEFQDTILVNTHKSPFCGRENWSLVRLRNCCLWWQLLLPGFEPQIILLFCYSKCGPETDNITSAGTLLEMLNLKVPQAQWRRICI